MANERPSKPKARSVARRSWWLFSSGLTLALGAGCSSSNQGATPSSAGAGARCAAGIQIECACPGGKHGAQACNEQGTAYGACDCSAGLGGSDGSTDGGGPHDDAGSPPEAQGGASEGGAGVATGSDAGQGGEAGEASTPPISDALDFPATPIFEAGVPPNAGDLFGPKTELGSGPLCVLEPQLSTPDSAGAMLPSNWLRPRFRIAADGVDLFEIRLHAAAEKHDLIVYTTRKSWYLPNAIWSGSGANPGLAAAAAGGVVTVTVRAIDSKAPSTPIGTSGTFNIAPAAVSGSIVFFTTRTRMVALDNSRLYGFSVGDEGVDAVLTVPQVAWNGELGEDGAVLRGYYDVSKLAGFSDGQTRCMGCHALTPDGGSLLFSDDYPFSKGIASIAGASRGQVPASLGKGAVGLLKMPWLGSQTMSPAHWSANDRILVTSYGSTFKSGMLRTRAWQGLPSYHPDDYIKWHRLAWIDLEANFDVDVTDLGYGSAVDARNLAISNARDSAWGLIATGDTGLSEVSPSFNRAGDSIVYVSTDYSPDGHPDPSAKVADLRIVPYNRRAGGVSHALNGASDPNYFEYDPAFSPDSRFVAFTRAARGGPDGPSHNRFGELAVIPARGGEPVRLAANDANSCAGDSPTRGLINASASWAPSPVRSHGKTYYFLAFTSARKYGDEFSMPFEVASSDTNTNLKDSSQVYIASVVVDDESGQVTSYPAVYVWNQNRVPGADGAGAGTQLSVMRPVWSPSPLGPIAITPAN